MLKTLFTTAILASSLVIIISHADTQGWIYRAENASFSGSYMKCQVLQLANKTAYQCIIPEIHDYRFKQSESISGPLNTFPLIEKKPYTNTYTKKTDIAGIHIVHNYKFTITMTDPNHIHASCLESVTDDGLIKRHDTFTIDFAKTVSS